MLRATTACTFSTSQLPKVVREWCVLYIFTWKCASRHNGVQFFISPLASWLRTRRFSEPTFRPSGAKNHWKNTVFRDFPTFSRICIFCLLTLSLLIFSSLCLFPALLFISPYCRSLTSKLPSITCVLHHHGTEHFSRERLRRVLRKKAHICRSTSSHLHICRSTSSHLHICRSASSHLHICRSSLSLPFFLPLFFLSLS